MCRQINRDQSATELPQRVLQCFSLGVVATCLALTGIPGFAQQVDGLRPPGPSGGPPLMEGRRPPMERAFHVGPPGRWWNNPDLAKSLGLTSDQQAKMDAVLQQSRPHLIDLSAALQKEEVYMDPLLSTDQPDEGKILGQIDHIAAARAELEKANARMLLGLRRILTQEQWKKLQAGEPQQHGHAGPPLGHRGNGPQPY